MNISLYYNQFFNCNKPSACFWNTDFEGEIPFRRWSDDPIAPLRLVTGDIPSGVESIPSWT